MTYVTVPAASAFFTYSLLSFALLAGFGRLYLWITPYNEMSQIREGKVAPALALGGALLGFTMPLLSLSYHGSNLIDFFLWSLLAGVFQVVLFKLLYRILPMEATADNRAVGTLYAFLALSVGLINAFSLIPG